ncbi:MAG: Ig-like domain-containing protein [Actinomycetota bacterium]|jgi:hypothetical protein|nr:Ig-like domain-containing protein [Actinomycetota bacterium]
MLASRHDTDLGQTSEQARSAEKTSAATGQPWRTRTRIICAATIIGVVLLSLIFDPSGRLDLVSAAVAGPLLEVAPAEMTPLAVVELGHNLDRNPRIVADDSGALLPVGTSLPCADCHDPHNLPLGTISLLGGPLGGSETVDGVRALCTQCHRPYDSAATTPTVEGLLLHKLGAGVSDHAEASTRLCSDCHGSSHYPTGHGESGDCVDCHGTTGSHAIHLSAVDPRGAGVIACETCHDAGDYPYFAAGTDSDLSGSIELAETSVCDTCHSPGGDYDGVDSANGSIGARDYWATKVYATTSTLKPGMELWCAGCHDGSPSAIGAAPAGAAIDAPNVVGQETASTSYGTGYGYYVTGHGRGSGPYPASQNPPADIGCDACHDFASAHIDSEARTYSSASDNYQDGYRLKDVGGGLPLEVPRTVWAAPASDFALCVTCHDSSSYLITSTAGTNFVVGSANSHYTHTRSNGAWPGRWDSDWDGTGDSAGNCPACHNVHGSPSPAMMRHGELGGRVPGLAFRYGPTSPDPYPKGPNGTGGLLDLPAGGGSVASNGVCGMCHGQSGSYSRAWKDLFPPRIMHVFGRSGSDQLGLTLSEDVYTTPSAGSIIPADLAFTDTDNGRSISSVSHTEGADHGIVHLSSALDSVDDIDVDTLAAATATSIYDASGLAMGTSVVVIEKDDVDPSISDWSPSRGATGVARNAPLSFTLSDSMGSGVDMSSFSITLSGSMGYSKSYTEADTSIVSASGTRLSYEVTIDPDALFSLGETITVSVSADDLVGNALAAPAWSFQVSATPTVETVVIHPSGLGSNPGGYWTLPGANQWATYFDSDDGDTTYATSNTGGQGATLYLAMDDPTLFGASIQSVKVHILARYVSGWSPVPPAYTGNADLGYLTGTTTLWTGSSTLPGTGSYTHVMSTAYATDSDSGALDIADINALQVAIKRLTSGGYPLRITEVYAEVRYIP